MNKKLVIYLFLSILLVGCVSAQYSYDPIRGPAAALDAMSNFYFNYAAWVDFFLLFVIFLFMVGKAIGDKFEKHGGKPLIVGIAFALALALSFWIKKRGLNLFGWITGNMIFFLFVIIVLFYVAYAVIEKIHDKPKWISVLLSYAAVYGLFSLFLGDQFELVLSEYFGYFIYNVPFIDILYYAALFCLVFGLIGIFFAKKVR